MLVKVYIRDEDKKMHHLNNWVVTGEEDYVVYDANELLQLLTKVTNNPADKVYKKMINKLYKENKQLKNKLIKFILENDN